MSERAVANMASLTGIESLERNKAAFEKRKRAGCERCPKRATCTIPEGGRILVLCEACREAARMEKEQSLERARQRLERIR